MSVAILLHGGTLPRRTALANALRGAPHLDVRVRLSSRAAEAAKCLADPAVRAVLLIDAPLDAPAVQAAVHAAEASHARPVRVIDLQPRDGNEMVIGLVRSLLSAP